MELTVNQKNELTEILDGDVYFDKLARKLYSTAACIYRLYPCGVVYPRHSRDVEKIVLWAGKHSIPLTCRGTGSGLAGQSVGEGLVLDFSRYMNRILEVAPESGYVRVQPGVVYGELNKVLAKEGKFFPPDPASGDYCTTGGMIGNNSSGPRSVKYGATKDYLMELDVILYTGEKVKISSGSQVEGKTLEVIYNKISNLLGENKELIEKGFPPVLKNSSGYNLKDAFREEGPDLLKILCGSEGTLAVITEAKLKILDIPPCKSTALLFFDDLEKLGKSVNITLPLGPSVIEMMDRGLIELVRKHKPHTGKIFPTDIEGALIVEFEGNTQEEVRCLMEKLRESSVKELVRDIKISFEAEEQAKLWKARKSATPLINSLERGERRPVTFIEDGAVHPDRFPEYIMTLRRILSDNGLDVIIYGHAGHGNVHVRPLLNLRDSSDIKLMKKVAHEVYREIFRLGGTPSGEHGDGLLRATYLKEFYGPLYDVMKEVKEIFDPSGIFNPGKIIAGKDEAIDRNLKFGADFKWNKEKYPMNEEELLRSLSRCHGCGMCRTFCPVYKAVGKEVAAPRAKANWIREFLRGDITVAESFESELAKELLTTCFNCHTCAVECPTGVDASLIARGAKYVFQEYMDSTLSDIIFQHAGLVAKSASAFLPLPNVLMKNPLLRILSEKVTGISVKRELPGFKKGNIISSFVLSDESVYFQGNVECLLSDKTVVYFPGCYERFYEPKLADDLIKILNINGYNVEVPETVCCEMPKISSGNWDGAGASMVRNIIKLYPFAKRGIKIVTLCPSCGLVLKKDYPYIMRNYMPEVLRQGDDLLQKTPGLMKNHMAGVVSEQVVDIHEFLLELYERGELDLHLGEINHSFIYHAPCHLRAEGLEEEPLKLLKLIPGLSLAGKTGACCGIAGSFGMKSENFKVSAKIAEETFKDVKDIKRDFSVTSCGTCKIQMKQFLEKRVIHPVKLLAESYREARER